MGRTADPEAHYQLAMLHLTMNNYAEAKAFLLAATKWDPQMGKAYVGLGTIYQLQANTLIRQKFYEQAEDSLKKGERYAKEAFKVDAADPRLFVQLGYGYKDLAMVYQQTGQTDHEVHAND